MIKKFLLKVTCAVIGKMHKCIIGNMQKKQEKEVWHPETKENKEKEDLYHGRLSYY